jgi:two-component system, NtrC family, response regulator AtoC
MSKYKIFIVDDDPWYSSMLEYYLLQNSEFEISKMTTGGDCIASLDMHPDLITLDYSLPDTNGGAVLAEIQKVNSNIPVIIISGQEDITTAVRLIKAGASDYFVKDDNTTELLLNAITRLRAFQQMRIELDELKGKLSARN